MTIGQKISQLRIQQNMSAKDFSGIFDITESELKSIESDEIIPSDDLRIEISQRFNLSSHQLMLESQDNEKLAELHDKEIAQKLYDYSNVDHKSLFWKTAFKWEGIKLLISMFLPPCLLILIYPLSWLGSLIEAPFKQYILIIPSILMLSVLFPQFILGEKFVKQVGKRLIQSDDFLKYYYVLPLSVMFFANMLSPIIDSIKTVFGVVPSSVTISQFSLAKQALSLLSSGISITVTVILSATVTYFLFKSIDIENENRKKHFKNITIVFCIIAVIYIAASIFTIVADNKSLMEIIIFAISIPVNISFIPLLIMVGRNSNKKNPLLFKFVPIALIVLSFVQMSALLIVQYN